LSISRSLIVRTERYEQDLLDRLCYEIATGASPRRRVLSKQSLLAINEPQLIVPPSFAPVSLAALGVGAIAARPLIPGFGDAEQLSRRNFLGRAAVITGASVTGVLLTGEEQEAHGFWGFVAAAAFGAVIGWFVNKVMDYAAYKLTGDDLTFTKTPKPTTSKYHNDYAAPYVVSNVKRQFKATHLPRYDATVGMSEVLLKVDLNHPEAAQIKKEHVAGKQKEPLVPTTNRYALKPKHLPALKKTAELYGLKPGDYKGEYTDVVNDNRAREHVGFGVNFGKKAQFLINDEA